MIDPHETIEVSTEILAYAFDVSPEWVRQLGDNGTLEIIGKKRNTNRVFDLFASVRAYCNFLREQDKTPSDISEAIQKADLKYKEARAGKMELELKELEGQMHRSEDVSIVVTDMIMKIRSLILALPGRLAVDTASAATPSETSAIIKSEIDRVLNEMSEYKYDPAEYAKLVQEREKWLTVKEAAETKAKAQQTAKRSRKPASTSKTSAKTSKPRKT